ncbi:MAG TPA: hypothetical protein DEG17_08370 [Cyanobacteria bacterium UBA11149]|nr:hypothetical protein [Cyanobacteria bacterium UBA11367]HBE57035.1 hypothetical protein [Cyanobacteria bacterium UBA11366]HBK66764.1 hypothetical protein [Cyanobacteria bacterium UBA11166]HBR73034.1 hypothetical protein [Cyanobacteria bacterium UBA11159]HBS72750.1 hypothetical protein [Cyanobacteria bacterium UBA11153]HBW88873.1 hypothetical protein [Cyanobacteria bacterium UBA11149]HCA97036.1 hypothetical protein [Cyanobacteria bacterium UBA9226]
MDVRILGTAQYYRILDLDPGASPEEVHQGYLDMTWVWHPDRFVGHPRLQQKAHYKLQELNEAHEKLRYYQATTKTREVRPKPKYQSPPPSRPSQSTNLSKPHQNSDGRGNEQRIRNHYCPKVRFNTNTWDDWLD